MKNEKQGDHAVLQRDAEEPRAVLVETPTGLVWRVDVDPGREQMTPDQALKFADDIRAASTVAAVLNDHALARSVS